MNRTTLKMLGCLLAVLTAAPALAQDDAELVEKVAVRNRLFSVAGRWELGGNVGFSLMPRLIDHYNLNLSLAVNFSEWLGLELRFGYAISMHTSLADEIQANFAANSAISKANDLSDAWELTGNAVLGLRFQPIYGKLNLVADLPVHFQLYVWAGGGAGQMMKDSLLICAQPGASGCDAWLQQTQVSPLVSLAVGFRFFVGEHHGLKIEARDYSWLDSYYVNVDRASTSLTNPTAGGNLSPNAGITTLVQIDLGYTYIF